MAEEKTEHAHSETKKGKKVNKMTLDEIEKKLGEIQETMGGHTSRYARHLIQRKTSLGGK